MLTSSLIQARWQKIFLAVAILVLAQVTWWTTAFMDDVNVIAGLKTENAKLSTQINGQFPLTETTEAITKQAFHRRVMFLSEAGSFVLLACVGMYLLFYALQVEQRARETQRNFVEIVSHESRTPLTALKLRLESIREKRSQDGDLSRELGLASEEVKRLVSLFEKALSLNRLEREALQFEVVHPSDTVREVLHRMDPLFRERGAKIITNLDPEAMVRADTHALQTLLQSLLENAVFYNDKVEKKLGVKLYTEAGVVIIAVEDNGPGVPEAERLRIFDRFFRGKSGGKVPGSGLGLYLAHALATAHGGSIRYSNAAAEGSCFEVTLPRVESVST